MNLLEIFQTRDSTIEGLNSKNILEISTFRDATISGEITDLEIKNRSNSKISLYNDEPQSIVIQRQSDSKITLVV